MKKIFILVIALFLSAATMLSAQMMLQPVASVNLIRPEMISRDQLDEKIEEMRAASPSQTVDEKRVLEIMINDVLVLQGAERAGITIAEQDLNKLILNQKKNIENQLGQLLSEEEFALVLKQAYGLTMEDLKDTYRQSYVVNTYIRSAKGDMIEDIPAPTEAEITSFYKKNAASFINPEYVNISHIYLSKENGTTTKPKEKAESILRTLSFGSKTFDELVIAHSQDDASKFVGGSIGWFAIDDTSSRMSFGDAFMDAVFELEAGEISDVLESKTGYHIVRVNEHTYTRLLALDDKLAPDNTMTVRQYISQSLYVEKQQEAYQLAVSSLVKDLREEAEVTILL